MTTSTRNSPLTRNRSNPIYRMNTIPERTEWVFLRGLSDSGDAGLFRDCISVCWIPWIYANRGIRKRSNHSHRSSESKHGRSQKPEPWRINHSIPLVHRKEWSVQMSSLFWSPIEQFHSRSPILDSESIGTRLLSVSNSFLCLSRRGRDGDKWWKWCEWSFSCKTPTIVSRIINDEYEQHLSGSWSKSIHGRENQSAGRKFPVHHRFGQLPSTDMRQSALGQHETLSTGRLESTGYDREETWSIQSQSNTVNPKVRVSVVRTSSLLSFTVRLVRDQLNKSILAADRHKTRRINSTTLIVSVNSNQWCCSIEQRARQKSKEHHTHTPSRGYSSSSPNQFSTTKRL